MKRSQFVALSLFLDITLVNLGFVLAFLLRFGGTLPTFNFSSYVLVAPFITIAFLAAIWANGLYDPTSYDDAWNILRGAVVAGAIGVVLAAVIVFLGSLRTVSFARSTLPIAWIVVTALLLGWRLLFLRFGTISWARQRVVIVGEGEAAVNLARVIAAQKNRGLELLGFVSEGGPGETFSDAPRLGSLSEIEDVVSRTGANRVIVANASSHREEAVQLVLKLSDSVRVDVVAGLYEVFCSDGYSQLGDVPLVCIGMPPVSSTYAFMKRALDIVFAVILLVLTAPVVAAAAVAICLDDGAPVFYTQERIGRGGKVFLIHKLRTMVRGAENTSKAILAGECDPRITKVGTFLRTYRIDELPQLIDILRGPMSFIGPRPERPEFVCSYLEEIPGYAERHSVRPGITGLAQIRGGYSTTAIHKLEYDLTYVRHRSLAMDARIVLMTFQVIFTGRGSR